MGPDGGAALRDDPNSLGNCAKPRNADRPVADQGDNDQPPPRGPLKGGDPRPDARPASVDEGQIMKEVVTGALVLLAICLTVAGQTMASTGPHSRSLTQTDQNMNEGHQPAPTIYADIRSEKRAKCKRTCRYYGSNQCLSAGHSRRSSLPRAQYLRATAIAKMRCKEKWHDCRRSCVPR
jgi:hypothetical protein